MRTRLDFIQQRAAANLAESGSDVTLRWVEVTGGTVEPVSGAIEGGTRTVQTLAVKGFDTDFSFQAILRNSLELAAGDKILDLAHDCPIEGKGELRFLIDGVTYMQKQVPSKLAAMWAAGSSGRRTMKTVLLTIATV